MTFARPWWLLAGVAVAGLTVLIGRYGTPTVPARQHRWATAVRLTVVVLLTLAAAQPALLLSVPERTVLFVVDRSASISGQTRAAQETFIADALEAARPGDRTGVAVFGSELRVDQGLAQDRTASPIRTSVNGDDTNLAAALRSAAALLPTEGSRRIVVLTDAVPTVGDARTAAEDLAREGIAVDIGVSAGGHGPDAVVEAVTLPSTARVGETVQATVVVRSNTAGPATLAVQAGDRPVEERTVQLEAGRNEFTLDYPVDDTGFLRVGANVLAPFDTVSGNNVAEGLTRILGPAQVAVVEGTPGDGDALARALTAGGLDTDLLTTIPSENALLSYDAIVLVNVPAPETTVADRLAAYVEDLGRGMVVVGGDNAYGLGDYQDTAFEELLPVRSNPDDLVRRQKIAEVLVIDTSGSMGTCHARGDTFVENGPNKTDLSRAGAEAAVQALSDQDRVGVLAFNAGQSWVLPLAPKPPESDAAAALATLTPSGNTEIARALRVALDELRGAGEDLRHIVLFSDGWDPNEGELVPLAQEISDAGITLSVVGTGEGAGTTLKRMAQIGGGRFYPGRNLDEIPQVFVNETLTVARNLAQEGTFVPALGSRSQVTRELRAAPPLSGYVLTRAKTTAELPLLIGERDPLLASWRRGLGRVSAWTSDASPRWSAEWVDWDGFASFWGDVVDDVLPAGREAPPEVRVSAGRLDISFDPGDVPLNASAVATVRSPDGEVTRVPLRRTGTTTFEGRTRVSGAGAYWVAVTVTDDTGTLASGSSGAVSSYSEEFAFRDPDTTLAADVTSATGGRVDPTPAAVFHPAPVRAKARRSIWAWFAAMAVALFMTDVTLRRIVFAGAVTRRSIVRTGEEPVEPEPEMAEPIAERETIGRLLDRKRRH